MGMTVLACLIRGINVGGNKQIKMATLREVLEALGFRDTQTYLQSGNVVLRASEKDHTKIGTKIETAIESAFGFRPAVILRTSGELREVVKGNPFAAREEISPDKLLVSFLSHEPAREALDKLLSAVKGPEEIRQIRRELYIYYPNGSGRSKLSLTALEKLLGIPGTSRNWNTVMNLLTLAETLETKAGLR